MVREYRVIQRPKRCPMRPRGILRCPPALKLSVRRRASKRRAQSLLQVGEACVKMPLAARSLLKAFHLFFRLRSA